MAPILLSLMRDPPGRFKSLSYGSFGICGLITYGHLPHASDMHHDQRIFAA
jgi:hypothetical protein